MAAGHSSPPYAPKKQMPQIATTPASTPTSMGPGTPAQTTAAQYRQTLNRCHLAPSTLGGSGQLKNVAPCWRGTNTFFRGSKNNMRALEMQAANLASKEHMVVLYLDMPQYQSATSTIPTGFWLSYIAQVPGGGPSVTNSVYVPNTADGQFPNLGN